MSTYCVVIFDFTILLSILLLYDIVFPFQIQVWCWKGSDGAAFQGIATYAIKITCDVFASSFYVCHYFIGKNSSAFKNAELMRCRCIEILSFSFLQSHRTVINVQLHRAMTTKFAPFLRLTTWTICNWQCIVVLRYCPRLDVASRIYLLVLSVCLLR